VQTVRKYQGLVITAPVRRLRIVTAYAGDLASVITRSTYRAFLRKTKRGDALAAWLLGFAVRRRHRIVALTQAGLRPPGRHTLINRLNCRPAGALVAGGLLACGWQHCPFCHARTAARLWEASAEWMFEPDPMNQAEYARIRPDR